jgi:hypothetical protein
MTTPTSVSDGKKVHRWHAWPAQPQPRSECWTLGRCECGFGGGTDGLGTIWRKQWHPHARAAEKRGEKVIRG